MQNRPVKTGRFFLWICCQLFVQEVLYLLTLKFVYNQIGKKVWIIFLISLNSMQKKKITG